MARCPKSKSEAFKRLDRKFSTEEKKQIMNADAYELHFTLGMWIRNYWIYSGEKENIESLLVDLGKEPLFYIPDVVSSDIIEAYQLYLREKSI